MELRIGYDRQNSTEMEAKYYVYDGDGNVIYKGNYTRCLVVIGAFQITSRFSYTPNIEEINHRTNGFLFGPKN